MRGEQSPNFVDGLLGQAASLMSGRLGDDLDSVTPAISFGNWLWPSRQRQLFCAASMSLKTIASAVLFERQPFDRIVRCRTVANVLLRGGAGGVGRRRCL